MRSNRPVLMCPQNVPEISTNINVVSGSKDFARAMSIDPPRVFASASIRLYLICAVGFLCSTMNGYDGSLLGGLLQNKNFRTYFRGSNTSIWVGIVSSLYQIGAMAAIPFIGPALDTWGRRKGIFTGARIIIIGTTIQGTSVYTHSLHQFMTGRFFLGFGAQLAACGGPIYVVEVCHPAYRGVVTGLFNTCWHVVLSYLLLPGLTVSNYRWTGAIIASGAVRGSLDLHGNSTWLLPVWLQLLCATTIAGPILFLPESPRWLFTNDKSGSAIDIVTKYHGMGNRNSAWVKLQEEQYCALLNGNGAV